MQSNCDAANKANKRKILIYCYRKSKFIEMPAKKSNDGRHQSIIANQKTYLQISDEKEHNLFDLNTRKIFSRIKCKKALTHPDINTKKNFSFNLLLFYRIFVYAKQTILLHSKIL